MGSMGMSERLGRVEVMGGQIGPDMKTYLSTKYTDTDGQTSTASQASKKHKEKSGTALSSLWVAASFRASQPSRIAISLLTLLFWGWI